MILGFDDGERAAEGIEIAKFDLALCPPQIARDFVGGLAVVDLRKDLLEPLLVVGDPAGTAQSALSKQNAYDMLRARGIAVVPALTNDITYRLESVNYFLQRTKMFALHPRCVTVREAMAGIGGFRCQWPEGECAPRLRCRMLENSSMKVSWCMATRSISRAKRL